MERYNLTSKLGDFLQKEKITTNKPIIPYKLEVFLAGNTLKFVTSNSGSYYVFSVEIKNYILDFANLGVSNIENTYSDFGYDIYCDNTKLYSSLELKESHIGFSFLCKFFNSQLIKDNLYFLLRDSFISYTNVAKQDTISMFQKEIDNLSFYYINQNVWYLVETTITYESRDTARVGKDTRTVSSTSIYFKIINLKDNNSNNKHQEEYQKHLNKFHIYKSEVTYGYYSADTDKSHLQKKIIDLDLSRYINDIRKGRVNIENSTPPIEYYKENLNVGAIEKRFNDSIKTLKVLVFFAFSPETELLGADYYFYDMIYVLTHYFKSIGRAQSQKEMLYEEKINEINFGYLYRHNKLKIDDYLSEHFVDFNLSEFLRNHYINSDHIARLYSIQSLHHFLKPHFSKYNNNVN